jgi:thiol-disulfide isomerase/thioredoxin
MKGNIINTVMIAIAMWASLLSINAQTQASTDPSTQTAAPVVYEAENKGWFTNIDEAYAVSKSTGKPILANFTGSDWCGWCKKLTADVFIHDAFKQWADKNVVLLEIDYPRRKQLPQHILAQNSNLQQAFQVEGYPTIWLFRLTKDEAKNQFTVEALGKTGYTPTVQEFTANLERMITQPKAN